MATESPLAEPRTSLVLVRADSAACFKEVMMKNYEVAVRPTQVRLDLYPNEFRVERVEDEREGSWGMAWNISSPTSRGQARSLIP